MLKTMRYLKIFCITGTIFFTLGYPIAVFSAEYPKSRGYLSDFAGVIDQQSAEMIVRIATEVEQKTSAQIAVVTITSLEGESLEYYANELFSQWKIGQKGKDNGALILLAAKERQVRIETGYGLEGIIPDGKAGDIIRESMLPYFKQGAIGKGMLSGTITIGSIIAEDAGVSISGNVSTMVGRSRGRRETKPIFASDRYYFLYTDDSHHDTPPVLVFTAYVRGARRIRRGRILTRIGRFRRFWRRIFRRRRCKRQLVNFVMRSAYCVKPCIQKLKLLMI